MQGSVKALSAHAEYFNIYSVPHPDSDQDHGVSVNKSLCQKFYIKLTSKFGSFEVLNIN